MTFARSLAARGVPPTAPPADRAAGVVRALVLRGEGQGDEDATAVLARGWIRGLGEAAAVLAAATGWPEAAGAAFGSRWPYLVQGDTVVAPALPVAVSTAGAEVEGPDAVYHLADGAVRREAGGAEHALMELSSDPGPPATLPALLWFGPAERYLVRNAELEISDLFAELRLPATAARLDRLLLRGRRLAPEVLDGISLSSEEATPPRLTVRRHRSLLPGGAPEPAELLGARVDVAAVRARSDHLEAELEAGGRARFTLVSNDTGWCLRLSAGDYPLAALSVTEEGEYLRYEVVLGAGLDPLRPGLRARLAFDLTSDLMVCGG